MGNNIRLPWPPYSEGSGYAKSVKVAAVLSVYINGWFHELDRSVATSQQTRRQTESPTFPLLNYQGCRVEASVEDLAQGILRLTVTCEDGMVLRALRDLLASELYGGDKFLGPGKDHFRCVIMAAKCRPYAMHLQSGDPLGPFYTK